VEAELSKINEILNRVEAQEMQPIIPDNIPLMQLADMVVRGKLSPSQMRLPIELLPYHAPKPTAVAHITDGSFGAGSRHLCGPHDNYVIRRSPEILPAH